MSVMVSNDTLQLSVYYIKAVYTFPLCITGYNIIQIEIQCIQAGIELVNLTETGTCIA